ncbi:MAG TPA: amino acid adenylation domain-containing protein, partial [Candidatus Polarisedimenticolaceae bacterium]|nr:amino acid adenylation domain-containing protein [Candidatus Polarisedimenticolaceae bacterium]
LAERSIEMVVGLLGILKAGGAYVPLDPSYPQERLAFMLDDSKASVLLASKRLGASFPNRDPRTVELDLEAGAIRDRSGDSLGRTAESSNLAYVIYTSGSTGRSKGVMVEHEACVRHTAGIVDAYELGPSDRVLQFGSLSFDVSVEQIFPTLAAGATLLPRGTAHWSTTEFMRRVRDLDITVLNIPTAFWHLLVHERESFPERLRLVIVGGESMAPESAILWEKNRPSRARLLNGYGPTEAVVTATIHEVGRREDEAGPVSESVPIGRALPDRTVYVLDPGLRLVPRGARGELFLGGIVARGYLGKPELTAASFLPDPYSIRPGARMYATGDVVRWRSDGTLEFMGRRDSQVKIRGVRIEPAEVEAELLQCPGVREAAVVARGVGSLSLAAYVVPLSPGAVDVRRVREFLRERLPDPMVPSEIVALEELPLTPSGKLDRRALPDPKRHATTLESRSRPRSPVEQELAGIWRRLLGLRQVGIHENFFELGGHSLLATQVVSRIRDVFGVELPLRRMFEKPTIARLAEELEAALCAGAAAETPPLRPVARSGPVPLSFAQERLWFLDQLEPGSASYNVPMAVRLEGEVEAEALERAFGEVMRRHEALRTRFAVVEGKPTQVIEEAGPFHLEIEDVRGMGEEERAEAVERRVREEGSRPFDLARGPLMRARLIRLSERDQVLVVVLHHIVADGWSLGVLVGEVTALYGAYVRGEPSPLPDLPVQYADFAAWQRWWLEGTTLASQLEYWKDRLEGAPALLELPSDRPRPAVRSLRGARRSFELPEPLASSLEELARREGATPFMVLLAAFDVLLHRYTGRTDVVVGTPIAGRHRAEIEGLIGFFVNTLVLRTDLSGDPSFREVVRRVRETALEAYAHQDIPFEKLVEELQPHRNLSTTPIFQVLFDVQNAPMPELELPGLALQPHEVPVDTAQFDLSMSLTRTAEGFSGTLDFDTDLFEAATIERMTAHFRSLLEGAFADPECRASQLSLLSEPEHRLLLAEWNDPRPSAHGTTCLHELFEDQVARTPEAIAVSLGEVTLTYRELDRRSTALARRLRAAGVGLESKVALFLDRSIEMLVAILGTLKAGGAYVPLDPDYRHERLAFMLEDSGAAVVVTRRSIEDRLPPHPVPIVRVDSDASMDDAPAAQVRVFPESAAYVIYTSGSTGRPKGVEVSHASVARIFEATAPWFRFGSADTWSLFHSFSFDVSVWEMWGALLHGGRLVLVPEDARRDPEAFRGLLEREGVTVLCQTPSSFRGLAELELRPSPPRRLEALRWVIFGGEALSPASLRPWLERYGDERPTLINMYGITETTIHASYRRMTLRDLEPGVGSVVGVPIPDLRLHLLDSHLQLVPVGVTGEIFVGGPGLARGYLHRPDLTAERFVPDPFAARPGERLYRSGDLARRLTNGEIEYLGRSDLQIKIRGFRVEPGEIESVLRDHPALREAVVLSRQGGRGDKRLVAYLIGASRERPTSSMLREFLADRLPDYMIPAAFVWLEAWPVTRNGKLDREALPEPERDDSAEREGFVEPASPVEEVLAGIWREVLELDRVGVHDDFFDLGGHSLLATQVLHRIRDAFRTELPLRTMFETPTVAGLARALISGERFPGAADRIARLRKEVEAMPADEVHRRLEECQRERDLV